MGSHGGFELAPVGDLFMIDRYREGLDREQTTRSECTEKRGWFIPAAKFQILKRTRVSSPVPAATLSQPSSDLSLAVQSPASGTGHKRDRDERLLGVCCRGFSDKPPDAVGHEAGHAFRPDFSFFPGAAPNRRVGPPVPMHWAACVDSDSAACCRSSESALSSQWRGGAGHVEL